MYRLAQNMEGCTAAQIRHVVEEAALSAWRKNVPISLEHLQKAYQHLITANKYQGPKLTWADLILPDDTKRNCNSSKNSLKTRTWHVIWGLIRPAAFCFTVRPVRQDKHCTDPSVRDGCLVLCSECSGYFFQMARRIGTARERAF
jgi:hypothetical protein